MERFGLTEKICRVLSNFFSSSLSKIPRPGQSSLGYAALAAPQRLYPAAEYVYQAMRKRPRGAGLYQP